MALLARLLVSLLCTLSMADDLSMLQMNPSLVSAPGVPNANDLMAQMGQNAQSFMKQQADGYKQMMTAMTQGGGNPMIKSAMQVSDWMVQANHALAVTALNQMEAMMGNMIKFNDDILQDDNVAKTVGFKKLGNQLNERMRVATHTIRELFGQATGAGFKAADVASAIGHEVAEHGIGAAWAKLQAMHDAGVEYSRSLLEVAHTAQDRMNEELQLATQMSKQSMTEAMDSVKSEQVKNLVTKSTEVLDAVSGMMHNLMKIQQKAEHDALETGINHMAVVVQALQQEAAAMDTNAANMQQVMAMSAALNKANMAGSQATNGRMVAVGQQHMQALAAEMQKFTQTMQAIVGQGEQIGHFQAVYNDAMAALQTMMAKQQRDDHNRHDHEHH